MARTFIAHRATFIFGIRISPHPLRRGKRRSTLSSTMARPRWIPTSARLTTGRFSKSSTSSCRYSKPCASSAIHRGKIRWKTISPRCGACTNRSGCNSRPTEHPPLNARRNHQAADTMTRFLIRRLLNMIPLILGITFISFLAMSLVPGDFVSNLKLNPTITPEVIHQLEAQFGLDQPLMVRYFKWLWGVLHLNFGFSLQYRVSVTGLIASRAFNTIVLSVSSMIFSWAIAIPIGIIVAVNQNSIWDRVLSFLAFFGMSVPSFFLAFLMMYLALKTGWFPIGGTYSPDYSTLDPMSQVADRIQHLILPVFVLGISGTAGLMRLMRSQILEIKNSEFVRTARAKGLSERVVIYKHVLRNALNPFVTMAGYSLGDLLGGAALVEAVMNLQGLGLLLLDAVRALDIYLVMGTVLLLLGNLLADVALVAVDPRVDFSSAGSQ